MNGEAKCHPRFAQVQYLLAGIGLAIGMGLYSGPSKAANVTIKAKVTERLEFDDNISRALNSPGEVYGSSTGLATDFNWRTPRLEISGGAGAEFKKFTGPGKTDNLDSFNQNANLGLTKKSARSEFSIEGSFRSQNSSFSELDDTDITNQDTDRLTYSLISDLSYEINSRNTVNFSGEVTLVDFSKSSTSLTPFVNISAEAGWLHRLTNLTDLLTNIGWSRFSADNAQKTRSDTFSFSSGIAAKLTPRLSIGATVGVDIVNTDQNQIGGGTTSSSQSNLGVQADIGVDYAIQNTQVSFSLSQGTQPSASGEVNQRTTAEFSIGHDINRRSNVGLTASVSRQESVSNSISSTRDLFSIEPKYSYQLAREWSASVAYLFVKRKTDTGSAQSNKLYFVVTRDLTIDP